MAIKYVVSFSAGDGDLPVKTGAPRDSMNRLASKLKKIASGSNSASWTIDCRNTAVAATGTVTYSTSSGAQTVVINGVTVYNATGASDAANATAAAAAINASTNALIQNLVTASAAAGVVTITASIPGKTGNCMTLAVTGTGAAASAARLTSGSEDSPVTFSF